MKALTNVLTNDLANEIVKVESDAHAYDYNSDTGYVIIYQQSGHLTIVHKDLLQSMAKHASGPKTFECRKCGQQILLKKKNPDEIKYAGQYTSTWHKLNLDGSEHKHKRQRRLGSKEGVQDMTDLDAEFENESEFTL